MLRVLRMCVRSGLVAGVVFVGWRCFDRVESKRGQEERGWGERGAKSAQCRPPLLYRCALAPPHHSIHIKANIHSFTSTSTVGAKTEHKRPLCARASLAAALSLSLSRHIHQRPCARRLFSPTRNPALVTDGTPALLSKHAQQPGILATRGRLEHRPSLSRTRERRPPPPASQQQRATRNQRR